MLMSTHLIDGYLPGGRPVDCTVLIALSPFHPFGQISLIAATPAPREVSKVSCNRLLAPYKPDSVRADDHLYNGTLV